MVGKDHSRKQEYSNESYEIAKETYYEQLTFFADRLDGRDSAIRAKPILEKRKKLKDIAEEFPEIEDSVNKVLLESEEISPEKSDYIRQIPFEYAIAMETKEEDGEFLIEFILPIFLESKNKKLQKKLSKFLFEILNEIENNGVTSGSDKDQFVSYIIKSKPEIIYDKALDIKEELKKRAGQPNEENLILKKIYPLDSLAITNPNRTNELEQKVQEKKEDSKVTGQKVVEIKVGIYQRELKEVLNVTQTFLSKKTKEKFNYRLLKREGYSKRMLDYIIKTAGIGVLTEVEARQRLGDNFEKVKGHLKRILYDGEYFYLKKDMKKMNSYSRDKERKPGEKDVVLEPGISRKKFLHILGYNQNYLYALRKNKECREKIPIHEKNLESSTLNFLIAEEFLGVLSEHDAIKRLGKDFGEYNQKFGGIIFNGKRYYPKKKILAFLKSKR